MSIRGLLGIGLVWLSVGHGPHLGLPENGPAVDGDTVRQTSDAWRGDTLKSLQVVRQQLKAQRISPVWEMRNPFLVAGKGDGEAAWLNGRLASTDPGTP